MKPAIDGFEPEVLKEYIDANTSDVHQSGVSYIFTCPKCEKSKKFYVRKRDGRSICFKCGETDGYKGNAAWALRELFGLPYAETYPRLYGEEMVYKEGHGLDFELVDFFGDEDELPEYECPLPVMKWPLDFYSADEKPFVKALEYLEGRGISLELARKYDIRWDPTGQRVILPVKVEGKLRGWQARYVHQTEWYTEDGVKKEILKILSTNGLTGGGVLMFQDNLIGSEHAVLCEGPFDALKADLCGGNVASMGKGINASQLALLRQYGIKRLYIAFDPDADDDIMRVAKEMGDMELYLMTPPNGKKDFGECTLEETHEAFKNAEPFGPSKLFVYLEMPKWMRAH